MQIFQRPYPHNWTHTLNLSRPPWDNKLVRQAANYAIDREGICESLLSDTCIAAIGEVYPGHPWFVDSILKHGLDQAPLPTDAPSLALPLTHEHVRGPQYYL